MDSGKSSPNDYDLGFTIPLSFKCARGTYVFVFCHRLLLVLRTFVTLSLCERQCGLVSVHTD